MKFSPLCVRACVHTHTQTKFCVLNCHTLHRPIRFVFFNVLNLSLRAMSIRPFVCDKFGTYTHSILYIVIFWNVLHPPCPWCFGRMNLKPIRFYYIWVGVVPLPLGAASELSPPQHFNDLSDIFSAMNSSEQNVKGTSRSYEGHVNVMSRPR